MNTVAEIRLHRLEVPLRTPYKLAFGLVRHFDTLIAEVDDSRGRTGLGEATVLTGYTDETPQGSWALMQRLAGRAVGAGVEDARLGLLAQVEEAPFTVTALVTALEMLDDARALSVPAAAQVPLLGLVNAESPGELEAEIEALLARGFRTLKVKVGFDARADARRLRLVQRAVRGRAAIRVDANQGYGVEDAKRFASGLEPEGIELFEQPCSAGDWEAAAAVAAVSTVPMMLDESIYGTEDIERAAELRAARFIKLKLMKLGSLERLASAIELVRDLGMEPVLGNGVACEIGCWMEALVAREHIRNAGEMNGYLKQAVPLLANPPRFEAGAIRLEPGYAPVLDRAALARVARDSAELRGRSASHHRVTRHARPGGATVVTGVIGSDTHIVGNRILSMALEKAGYKVVALGALTPAEEFVKAAVETNADVILVSSLYGQGELDCRGFRELCIEAGLDDILLYIGGNLIVGKHPWETVERIFLDMGFDRAAAPGTRVETVLEWLAHDLAARRPATAAL